MKLIKKLSSRAALQESWDAGIEACEDAAQNLLDRGVSLNGILGELRRSGFDNDIAKDVVERLGKHTNATSNSEDELMSDHQRKHGGVDASDSDHHDDRGMAFSHSKNHQQSTIDLTRDKNLRDYPAYRHNR